MRSLAQPKEAAKRLRDGLLDKALEQARPER
jgi:hypothetical protein